MATNFPTSLDSLTNPTAVDTLDSPPHDTQHADANDAIEALQAKVGVDSSGVVTSHDYKIDALETDVSNINELQINNPSTSYTLALTDSGKLVQPHSASANDLTIPPNSSVAFPVGTQILVVQVGAGQVTLVEGSGVLIESKDGNKKLSGQFSAVTLIQRATDVWLAIGDLSA